MDRLIVNSKQEFLDKIKKASAIILYVDTSLPIWRTVLCSVFVCLVLRKIVEEFGRSVLRFK